MHGDRRRALYLLLVVYLAAGCTSAGMVLPCETFAAPLPSDQPRIESRLELVADVASPTSMVAAPERGLLWIGLRGGQVVAVDSKGESEAVVDLSEMVLVEGEGGLLDLAVSPGGLRLFVSFTDIERTLRVVSYPIEAGMVVGPATEHVSLDLDSMFHTGGSMEFGPDGFLYVGVGDGASPDEIQDQERSQDPADWRGTILQIGPEWTASDSTAAENAPKVVAVGLRNPWSLTYDPQRGLWWIGDVGESCNEEVNWYQPGSQPNFGWPILEGANRRLEGDSIGMQPPVFSYPHITPGSAIIGGALYEGREFPELAGNYIFADFGEGALYALDPTDFSVRRFGFSVPQPTRVIAGPDGELWVLSASAGVFRVVGSP